MKPLPTFMNSNKTNLNPINNKIGFTSRIESRKHVHYLDGLKGFVLSALMIGKT